MNSFDFVHHTPLRERFIETLWYIEFLLSIEKTSLTSETRLLINRDLIIHSVSILEWLLLYLLIEIEHHWSEDEKKSIKNYTIKTEYKPIKLSKEFSITYENEDIYFCKRKEVKGKIDGKWNLGNIVGLIKKLNIFPKEIEDGIENIQHIRNDIHLQRIIEDIKITKELTDSEMLELFQFTQKLQKSIKEKLKMM